MAGLNRNLTDNLIMKIQSSLPRLVGIAAIAAGVCCLATNLIAAAASPSPAADQSKPATNAQLDSKDRDFMMTAAKGGMMEVHMGQMAAKEGQSAEVKKLANQMVTDHTKANNQLMALASSKGVKLDTRHKMDKISGDKFDDQWLSQMVADHQKTIAAFEAEAKGGKDPAVKDWASKTLPTLKKHLKMVQDTQAKMKKAG